MKKKVAHYKYTNCAWAPDELVKCFNKYSENYEAVLVHNGDKSSYEEIPKYVFNSEENAIQIFNDLGINIVHFHNKYVNVNIPSVIQYHSPPWYSPAHWTDLSYNGKKLVVGQYHATLGEFSNCQPVPNIIDIYDDVYTNIPQRNNSKIKIGFSPSCKHKGGVETKGFDETSEILNKIVTFHGDKVEIDIIHGVPIKECLNRKAQCDILIDECMTKSYHRSGLEGLALGKLTICSLGNDVTDVVKKMMNVNEMPFINTPIEKLEAKLIKYIFNKERKVIKDIGKYSRTWMEKNWNPKNIIKMFENIYDGVINEFH